MFKTTDSTFRMRITSYHESVSPIWAIIQSLKLNKEKTGKSLFTTPPTELYADSDRQPSSRAQVKFERNIQSIVTDC